MHPVIRRLAVLLLAGLPLAAPMAASAAITPQALQSAGGLLAGSAARPGSPVTYNPSMATGGSTARTQADRLADVVDIMDGYGGIPGAKCDGVTDDGAAINAATAEFRRRLNAGKAAKLVLGRGNCRFTRPLDFTGLVADAGVIDGTASTLQCATVGAPCIDAVGTYHLAWQPFHLIQVGGSPTVGLQIARATAELPCGEQKFISPFISGTFSQAAMLVVACETDSYVNVHLRNDSTVANSYALIMDGANHWNVRSTYDPTSMAVDSFGSFNENVFFSGTLISAGPSGQVWSTLGNRHRYLGVYALGTAPGSPGFTIWNPVGGALLELTLDLHFEYAPSYDILVAGPNPTPTLSGLKYYNHFDQSTSAMIGTDRTITAVDYQGLDLQVPQTQSRPAVFSNPGIVTASGQVRVPEVDWNLPSTRFQGELNLDGAMSWSGTVPLPRVARAYALAPLSSVGTLTTTGTGAIWSIPAGGTNFPAVTIGPPQATDGTRATARITGLVLDSACGSLLSGGSGYAVNDRLGLSGGTASEGPQACRVTSVGRGGTITALAPTNARLYTVMPVNTRGVPLAGGSGSGAALHGLRWAMSANATRFMATTTSGSGYAAAPPVSFPATQGVSLIQGTPAATAALVPGGLTVQATTLDVAGSATIGTVLPETGAVTLTRSMCDSTLRYTGRTAARFTVPGTLPLNCKIDVVQAGAGTVTMVAGPGETPESPLGKGTATAGRGSHVQVLIDAAGSFDVHP